MNYKEKTRAIAAVFVKFMDLCVETIQEELRTSQILPISEIGKFAIRVNIPLRELCQIRCENYKHTKELDRIFMKALENIVSRDKSLDFAAEMVKNFYNQIINQG